MINNPALLAALKGDYEFCNLITIAFDDGNLYVTDGDVDIVHEGATYLAGLIDTLGDIKSATGIKINDVKLEFNVLFPSVAALALNRAWMNRRVTIRRRIDALGYVNTLHVYAGLLSDMNITGDIMTFNTSSIWKDFEKTNGRKTNPESHQRKFPATNPFQYIASMSEAVYWGKKGDN